MNLLMKKLSKYQNVGFRSQPFKGNVKLLVDAISKEEYLQRRSESKDRPRIGSQEERKVSKGKENEPKPLRKRMLYLTEKNIVQQRFKMLLASKGMKIKKEPLNFKAKFI